MAAKFPSPGEVFEEAYRIEAILGSGGFARVYRAIEEDLNRPVALKILRPPVNSAQSDTDRDSYLETLTERFQREAMLLSKLRSNYTVNLYKYGKTDDGLLYMALEYIDGLSLAEIMRAGKPLEPARVAKIIKQVLASLQEAHTLGMLHRDLKPANIMVFEHLGEKDQVKLLDFGIAKLVTESQPGMKADLTSDGTLIGTPRYMAPEQIQGTDIGPPADIYALGLVAYELLTGERAIKGDSSIQIIGKQLAPQSFKVPESPNIPPMIRDIVNTMMAKEIPERYQSADEVIGALEDEGLLAVELGDIEIEEVDPAAFEESLETIEDAPLFDDEPLKTAGVGDEDTGQFEEEEEFVPAQKKAPVGVIALAVVALLVVVGAFAIFTGDEPSEDQGEKDQLVEKKKPKKEDEDSLEQLEKREPATATVRITARLDGKDVEGATVLVNGVEKGVTPLTLEAPEVENSQLIARYKPIDGEKPLEEVQDVTNPRDVLFEFDDVVGELIKPDDGKPDKQETKPEPDPPRKKVKHHRRKRKPRDNTRPDPKPKPKPDNPYFVPE